MCWGGYAGVSECDVGEVLREEGFKKIKVV